MHKLPLYAVVLAIWAAIIGGCSQPTIPAPATHAPFSLPTLIPPTRVPPTPLPTATPSSPPPTQTPLATAVTTVAVEVANVQSSPSAGSPAVTPSPVASPTPIPSPTSAIPPGLYVTDLRIDPPPVRGPDLKFYVTFLNSMEREQSYRWAVHIFRADTQKGIGETTRTDAPIPTGIVEQPSLGSWRLPLGGPCEYFYAQVGWIDAENKITWFTTPSGSIFQKGFAVCPP